LQGANFVEGVFYFNFIKMLKNYLLLAFRNMKRQPAVTFINVLGLAFGMAATIILTLFVKHERSFEAMHNNAPRIYRIITKFHGHFDYSIPYTLALTGPGLSENIPEIESFSRILSRNTTLEKDDNHFTNIRLYYVDSGFSEIFSFPVLEGDLKNSLNNPSHIVLTRKVAENLFPVGSAVGQVLEMDVLKIDIEKDQLGNQRRPFVVGAVLEDPPTNTHLQFDVLAPLLAIPDEEQNKLMNFFATYFLLNAPPDNEVEEKITTLATRNGIRCFWALPAGDNSPARLAEYSFRAAPGWRSEPKGKLPEYSDYDRFGHFYSRHRHF
jgi:putative ABC transport system permease protein